MGLFSEDTIAMDPESIKSVYDMISKISIETISLMEKLATTCENAQEQMKGDYERIYNEKREDIFKNLKKQGENIDKLSKDIEGAAKDFLNLDIKLASNIEVK